MERSDLNTLKKDPGCGHFNTFKHDQHRLLAISSRVSKRSNMLLMFVEIDLFRAICKFRIHDVIKEVV